MSRTPRNTAKADQAPSASSDAPAPSPAASAEPATDAADPASDPPHGAAPPESPAPAGAASQPLVTEELDDPPPGGKLEQLETLDPVTGLPVPPVVGADQLGGLALDADDASAARTEPLPPIEDAALADAHLTPGDPAIDPPDVELPPVDPSAPAELGVSEAEADLDDDEGEEDEAEWRARLLRRMTRPGVPVLFREHGRRFNGETTTPAIVTRVYDDLVVNLMVLPDGGEPYPRMGVAYEAKLDPDALGRAWSHIHFDDD